MSSDTCSLAVSLPTELLYIIFRLVTQTIPVLGARWPPFAEGPGPPKEQVDTALRDKRNIAHVCGSWRPVAIEFLYEELIVTSANAWVLLELLKSPSETDSSAGGYGPHVRCIKSHQSFAECRPSCGITDFLRLCPNVEIISICKADAFAELGPEKGHFIPNIDASTRVSIESALTSLRAIFWADGKASDRAASKVQWGFLLAILELSPNVEFLSIPGSLDSFGHVQSGLTKNPQAVKNIKYLELQPATSPWYVPAGIWEAVSGHFPNLREISQHVGRPAIPKTVENHTVASFRLHPHLDPIPPDGTITVTGFNALAHEIALREDLEPLAGPGFPSIERVVLYGDWSTLANSPTFQGFERSLLESGRRLIFVEGRPHWG
ncbi:hypothetical protein FB451DRAFT_1214991 [Mycena latifolia]|nr:hypothetical protein FB451DRAFT_1214991 [Mycena latifolia]